ncbi:hypothetical protein [Paraburkholderia rhizosphaerae]|uniref:Beta-barrel assembly machine subunit BamE n=1 Tax=Paraburkholderia rhizosphaerae TaxID=480658 RepID=A0A4R8M0V7_9BURK|nr:hypothetical protein [Paraburkholderia rhizosphaerae]TDY54906.1 hypothetical protein BX592_101362 [Paraburkholderia rhizosphaerae]
MSRRFAWLRACALILVISACAQPHQQIQPGADEASVIARLGPPRETYNLPDGGRRLMWPTQPMGTTTTAVDIDASGKVVSARQVLQASEFARAQVGVWTRDDVLVNFGRPFETSYFRRMQREVWSYRYQENNITNLIFSFYFDDQGILRLTQKTPDTTRDPSMRGRF